MAPRNPRNQQDLFYNLRWNSTYEKEFVYRLAEYARLGEVCIKRSDLFPIRSSIDIVNQKYGTNFTYKEAHQYFKQLQQRHTVFGFIVTLPHVTFDLENNFVHADPYVWDYVTLKYPLAEAYMRHSECLWEKLCLVFGNPIPVDVFAEPDVIQISDDHSAPARAGSSNHNVRPPRNPSVERNPPDLPMSFWNNLGRIAGASDVSSQGSIQNLPTPRDPTKPLSPPYLVRPHCTHQQVDGDDDNLQVSSRRGRRGPTGSFASSSGTPKKPPRN